MNSLNEIYVAVKDKNYVEAKIDELYQRYNIRFGADLRKIQ